ncbi:MAG: amidohydrolase family protein, partial [Actinomycetota bacterium]
HPTDVGLALAAPPDAVVVSDALRRGAERLPDGTLAGSAIDLSGALTRILALGLPPARAVRHVTGNPAHALGLPDRGRLVPGARADLVAIDPLTAAVSPVHPG